MYDQFHVGSIGLQSKGPTYFVCFYVLYACDVLLWAIPRTEIMRNRMRMLTGDLGGRHVDVQITLLVTRSLPCSASAD